MQGLCENGMSLQNLIELFLRSMGISIGIAFLFYRSGWGMFCFPIVLVFEYKQKKKRTAAQKKAELEEQMVHGMKVLNRALCAGLSMENAWREVEREMRIL